MDIEADILQKSLNLELDFQDALKLVQLPDRELFWIADQLRIKSCGNIVSYVVNCNLNFTNICKLGCLFCAFSRDPKKYFLSMDQILERVQRAHDSGAVEICIQGGILDLGIEFYCELLDVISSHFPRLHLHAFSPMEIWNAARVSGMDIPEALRCLRSSGLGSIPGTAAEILSDDIRSKICPKKLSSSEWIYLIRTAHELGIPTTSTIMYGHLESYVHRLKHLLLIRDIQEMTGGFTEFVLLPFMPKNNPLGKYSTRNLRDDLRMHALARIILSGYIRNIQASWVKLGIQGALRALQVGANDLGGTLMEERISSAAGASHAAKGISPQELDHWIRSIGRIPKRRTTLYSMLD